MHMHIRIGVSLGLALSFLWVHGAQAQDPVHPNRPAKVDRPQELPDDKSLGEGPELDGYCPVAYQMYGMAKKGNTEFKVVYQGNIYFLSSEEAKKAFEADAEAWLPQFGGWCATSLSSFGNRIKSDPTVFDIFNKKVYLFSSERARKAYYNDQAGFVEKATTRWNDPELGGRCPVTWASGQPQPGKAELSSIYHGLRYFLSSAEAKKAFDADPSQYLGCEIFCANATAQGKKPVEGKPDLYLVHAAKVYVFETPAAMAEFSKDAEGNAAKVAENWKKLMRPTKILRRDRYEGK